MYKKAGGQQTHAMLVGPLAIRVKLYATSEQEEVSEVASLNGTLSRDLERNQWQR